MKKIAHTTIMAAMCVVMLCLSACSKPNEELFTETTLQYYNLDWLTEPDGAMNAETNVYESDGNYRHTYTAQISEIEEFERYVQDVFEGMKQRNYLLARHDHTYTVGELWSMEIYELYFAVSTIEMCRSDDSDEAAGSYWIGYNTDSRFGKYIEKVDAYELKKWRIIVFDYNKNEDNDYNIRIWVEDRLNAYLLKDSVP